jgi:hypothetical protein
MIEITSGENKREVLIQNCGLAGPAGPPGPAGPQARWVLQDPREIPAKPLINKSDHKRSRRLRGDLCLSHRHCAFWPIGVGADWHETIMPTRRSGRETEPDYQRFSIADRMESFP